MNDNTFKKKIPFGNVNGNKNALVNLNETKNLGCHKKNISYNPEISGVFSIRPKSSKQTIHVKKDNNNSSYKVTVNISNNLGNIQNNKGNSNDNKGNINFDKKEVSLSFVKDINTS